MLVSVSCLVFIIWIVLFFVWGNFWQIWEFDSDRAQFPAPPQWPPVTAVVPARNEAASIEPVISALAAQDYAGEFSVVVVDDHSGDGTTEIAHRAATAAKAASRIRIISAPELVSGWTGKLWALNAGVKESAPVAPEFYWFTDADVVHATDALRRLVSRAEVDKLDLTSLMVLLRGETFPERLLIPAFLYFFLMLYPPKWIAKRDAKTAGAAGGCVLLRRSALEGAGGLAAIRREVIDDCALARAVKRSGGSVWMGLTRASKSLRSYEGFSEIRDMIARTAFTQLRYSTILLAATFVAMILTFVLPLTLTFSGNIHVWPFALTAWCLMTASFLPTVTFYRLRPIWAPLLPLAALFYAYATCLSAARYWLGRGGQWKGRSQASNISSRTS
jgi:hopene-associated glycosyltransferase HpnB